MNTNDTIKTSKQWDGLWFATFGDFDLGDAIGTGATEAQAVSDLYLWADINVIKDGNAWGDTPRQAVDELRKQPR